MAATMIATARREVVVRSWVCELLRIESGPQPYEPQSYQAIGRFRAM